MKGSLLLALLVLAGCQSTERVPEPSPSLRELGTAHCAVDPTQSVQYNITFCDQTKR